MGEARRRGTFEQRKSAAIKRADDLSNRVEAQQRLRPRETSRSIMAAILAAGISAEHI